MREISGVDVEQVAFPEGPCFMQLVMGASTQT